jgi:hypothetical protein
MSPTTFTAALTRWSTDDLKSKLGQRAASMGCARRSRASSAPSTETSSSRSWTPCA